MKEYLTSLSFWIKILLIGMIFHFFAHTTVTFWLWIELSLIWVWKEVLIIGLAFFLAYNIAVYFKDITKDKVILFLELVLALGIGITFLVNFFVLGTSLVDYIMAIRYDFLGFIIFFILYHLGNFLEDTSIKSIIYFFWKFIKILLILWIFWYAIIFVKPGWLDYIWYDSQTFEWEVWEAPPAAYYTQQTHGFPRNQLFFERPINYGFFLVFFFPLFYVLFLRRKSLKKTWFWWWAYVFSIISTFSRAAWGAWLFQLIVLTVIEYWKNIKKFVFYLLLPILLVFGVFVFTSYDQVVERWWSDTGHFEKISEAYSMFAEAPILWKGAGYVGPVSHHWGKEFNPENQYLLILVQYGIVGFVFRGLIYGFLCFVWFYYFLKFYNRKNKNNFKSWLILALSLGMIWLSIESVVLHWFVDRMVVYPSMVIFGLAYYYVSRSSNG